MKGFNRKNAFARQYLGDSIWVYFREYNDRAIICTIEDEYLGEKFRARSRVHPEDTFDAVLGKKIAFEKAAAKRSKRIKQIVKEYSELGIQLINRDSEVYNLMKHRVERLCSEK